MLMQKRKNMKTIILYSSSNKHGNTADACEKYLSKNRADILYLDDFTIHDYSYDHRHKDDDFRALFLRILEYDHIVFASPVYWYAITPRMKAFFDRISEYMDDESLQPVLRKLRGKAFSIHTNSINETAPEPMVAMLVMTCKYLGMNFKEQRHFYYPEAL
jgi:multimeric flavodoxin WrbA